MSDAPDGIHRLVDMVVEEVSLVDRPANLRRFLVVKRDEMKDQTQIEKAPPPEQDLATADASESGDYNMDGTPLGVAAEALESLTAIVEMLSAGDTEADPRLAELAQELRALCEQLLGEADDSGDAAGADAASGARADAAAGADGAATKADEAAPGTTKPSDAAQVARTKQVLASLSQIALKLGRKKKPAASSAPAPAMPATKQEAVPSPDVVALKDSVTKLTESVQALTASMTEDRQRLARVEKQFGISNSAALAERKPRATVEDVGWPLDLNRPMDRESVDKSVSFHDP